MTGYQISAGDLSGFKMCNAGQRAMQKHRDYMRTVAIKKLTPADRLARIEALERKAPVKNLATCRAVVEAKGENALDLTQIICRKETVKGHFPAVSAVLTLVFACIFTLIVYSSVQYSDAKRMHNDMRDQLAASNSEIVRLEGERDARVDLEEVERIAVEELGMIQKDKAEKVFVSVGGEGGIVLENTDNADEAEVSLLSAFAQRIKALWEYLK
ncbi:MAG: hypothetical protein IJF74_00595 [Clostridia bacterium]|nr:hypothetical protein [Clostridia bacterium]